MTSRRFTIYVFSFIVAASVLFAAVKLSLTPQAVTSPLPTNILSKPQTTALPTETFPSVSFSEISGATGIDFKYDSGSLGDFHLTETLGGGLAVFDYNSDGNLDLFFVQGGTLSPRDHPSQSNRLFRNNGDGTFRDVTEEAGLQSRHYGHGCAVGDYDNDGDSDLYVSNFGTDSFYRNNGNGTFTDITEIAGLGCHLSGTGCAFGDFDSDGQLDLYVANYITLDLNMPPCYDALGLRIYCPPPHHPGQADVLYRNNGDGTFSDISDSSGIGSLNGRGLGVLIADLNDDGRVDIYVANDATSNYYFENTGEFTFSEKALQSGLAVNRDGVAEGSMGIAYGDLDGDHKEELFITNYIDETHTLYRSLSSDIWEDETQRMGLAPLTRSMIGWGTQFVDFNNDSHLDIFIANGNINNVEKETGEPYAMEPQLLYNNGNNQLLDMSDQSGTYFTQRWNGRSAAFGDLDKDGDIDIVVTHLNQPIAILRNELNPKISTLQETTSNINRFLIIQLVGNPSRPSNRQAIGARILAKWGDRHVTRSVISGGSYLSSSSPFIHFGIDPGQAQAELEIQWPSGYVQSILHPLTTDQSGDAWLVVEGTDPVPLPGWNTVR